MAGPVLPSSAEQVRRLTELLTGRQRALIVTHDSPDPDAIAAALCMSYLLDSACSVTTRIVHGGIVGRPANRDMVNMLRVPMVPVDAVRFEPEDAVVVVDTQPGFANNSLPEVCDVVAVIDHHPGKESASVPLWDVRPTYGAACTIMTEYLVSAGLALSRRVATAICFGISTETQDLGREASAADIAAFLEAYPESDQPLLGRLRHPQLSVPFIIELERALRRMRVANGVGVCHLGEVDIPDDVAAIADQMSVIEGIEWVMCTGVHDGRMVISVRTTDRQAEAGQILRRAVGEEDRAGGHGMIAGGALPLAGRDVHRLEGDLTRRLLSELGIRDESALQPLIPSVADWA